jgi:hypothetical protein
VYPALRRPRKRIDLRRDSFTAKTDTSSLLPSFPSRLLETLAVLVLGHLFASPFLCVCHGGIPFRHPHTLPAASTILLYAHKKMKRWYVGCWNDTYTIQTDLFVVGQHSVMDIAHVRDLPLKARLGKISRYRSAHLFRKSSLSAGVTPQQTNIHLFPPRCSAISTRHLHQGMYHAFPEQS